MKKILLPLMMSAALAACSSPTDPSDLYHDQTRTQIYTAGKSALQDKRYAEAITRFEALDVQYPFGIETENAQLYLIYAYYMREDYALAMMAADRFIRLHATHPHVDYAFYMRGLSDFYQNMGVIEKIFAIDLATRDLTQVKKSYDDFQSVVLHFPHSRYAPSARQYMVYLRNIMANHELEVAKYYYSRHAYVAAANRASELVAHFSGAPAVKPGLVLLIKSYRALKLDKLAADAEKIYTYNYNQQSSVAN